MFTSGQMAPSSACSFWYAKSLSISEVVTFFFDTFVFSCVVSLEAIDPENYKHQSAGGISRDVMVGHPLGETHLQIAPRYVFLLLLLSNRSLALLFRHRAKHLLLGVRGDVMRHLRDDVFFGNRSEVGWDEVVDGVLHHALTSAKHVCVCAGFRPEDEAVARDVEEVLEALSCHGVGFVNKLGMSQCVALVTGRVVGRLRSAALPL